MAQRGRLLQGPVRGIPMQPPGEWRGKQVDNGDVTRKTFMADVTRVHSPKRSSFIWKDAPGRAPCAQRRMACRESGHLPCWCLWCHQRDLKAVYKHAHLPQRPESKEGQLSGSHGPHYTPPPQLHLCSLKAAVGNKETAGGGKRANKTLFTKRAEGQAQPQALVCPSLPSGAWALSGSR